jgi:hypothetical protein
MTDDEILQLASKTSGAHYMDHSHVIRFARAVIDKVGAPSPCLHIRSSGTGEWATNWCSLNGPDHTAVMQQALEALDSCHAADPYSSGSNTTFDEDAVKQATTALRAALGEKE